MIEAKIVYREKYILYYEINFENLSMGGGINNRFEIVYNDTTPPFREFLLRCIINKAMDTDIKNLKIQGEWNVDLEKFGFKKVGDFFQAESKELLLPHLCK